LFFSELDLSWSGGLFEWDEEDVEDDILYGMQ
jgi:hypothetical protein